MCKNCGCCVTKHTIISYSIDDGWDTFCMVCTKCEKLKT